MSEVKSQIKFGTEIESVTCSGKNTVRKQSISTTVVTNIGTITLLNKITIVIVRSLYFNLSITKNTTAIFHEILNSTNNIVANI